MAKTHSSTVDVQLAQIYQESDELFTAYMKSFSPFPSATTVDQGAGNDESSSSSTLVPSPPQSRTLRSHNLARVSLLPMFPHDPMVSTAVPHLLLANVPSENRFWTFHVILFDVFVIVELLSESQYTRIRRHAYPGPFKLEMNSQDEDASKDSFMGHYYEQLYVKPNQQLKVDIPIIDYNLTRLRKCLAKVAAQRDHKPTMLTMDELPLALEFYLQIDGTNWTVECCPFIHSHPSCESFQWTCSF